MRAPSKSTASSGHPRPPLGAGFSTRVQAAVAAARDGSRLFQRQWVILFLFGVLALTTVAGMYLNVTSSAAIAGREIQNMESEISIVERTNADLQTNIATLLSNKTLAERAQAMNFKPVERTSLEYMVVPGYFAAQGVRMVAVSASEEKLVNRPEFNETLIDWMKAQIKMASIPLIEMRR